MSSSPHWQTLPTGLLRLWGPISWDSPHLWLVSGLRWAKTWPALGKDLPSPASVKGNGEPFHENKVLGKA